MQRNSIDAYKASDEIKFLESMVGGSCLSNEKVLIK